MSIILDASRATSATYLDIARGVYANASRIHKFGANPDIDTGSAPESVWSAGGMYPWDEFSLTQYLYIQSDNAADVGTIEVQGLDADYNLITEPVSLNGTQTSVTLNRYKRVFRLIFTDTTANVGTITARTQDGLGTVVAQIDAGAAQTLMAIYTVPKDYTAYLAFLDVTVDANKVARINFKARNEGGAFRIQHPVELSGDYSREFVVPVPFAEKTDIDVVVESVESNNTKIGANFDLILIKKESAL